MYFTREKTLMSVERSISFFVDLGLQSTKEPLVMKNSELKSLADDELVAKLETERENLKKLKFAHAISPLENPMSLRGSRRLVARIATEIRSRELKG